MEPKREKPLHLLQLNVWTTFNYATLKITFYWNKYTCKLKFRISSNIQNSSQSYTQLSARISDETFPLARNHFVFASKNGWALRPKPYVKIGCSVNRDPWTPNWKKVRFGDKAWLQGLLRLTFVNKSTTIDMTPLLEVSNLDLLAHFHSPALQVVMCVTRERRLVIINSKT